MSTGAAGPERTIGGRIAQARFSLAARLGRNVTQAWLAQQAGVSGPTVSQWESGVTEPTVASIAKIATALGVSPAWLAWGEPNVQPGAIPEILRGARKLTEEELDRADAIAERAKPSAKKATTKKRANGRRA